MNAKTYGGTHDMVPSFLEMAMSRHEASKRRYRVIAALTLAVGLIGLIVVLVGPAPFWPWGAACAMLAAVAAFPARQVVELDERVEGLEVLRDEWLEHSEEDDAAKHERFARLIGRLY